MANDLAENNRAPTNIVICLLFIVFLMFSDIRDPLVALATGLGHLVARTSPPDIHIFLASLGLSALFSKAFKRPYNKPYKGLVHAF